MLSILISTFNYDCRALAVELSAQCVREGIVFEILVLDDASTKLIAGNQDLEKVQGCRFLKNPENMGSARTRNRLGNLASFDKLLFIDGDLEVIHDSYIRNYLNAIDSAPVIVGSVTVSDTLPPPKYRLRWKYSRKREHQSAKKRNADPWKSFISQNFIMDKCVFLQVPFDETFHDYGHEDTLMGWRLRELNIPVLYLDNPLLHLGLDENKRYLEKSLLAVSKYLTVPELGKPPVSEQIKIFRTFNRLRLWKLEKMVLQMYRLFRGTMYRNLTGPLPSLILFDLYRLGYLCQIVLEKNAQEESLA